MSQCGSVVDPGLKERSPVKYLSSVGVGASLLCLLASPVKAICFVTANGASSNTGDQWASPYDLQTALKSSSCTEIWVAAGAYFPTSDANPAISFTIKHGKSIYGGFAGTETQRSQRDPATNRTILSGDIDHNDAGNDGIDSNPEQIVGGNSFHVVVVDGTTAFGPVGPDTVLDGFTVTGGSAYNANYAQLGGGLLCFGVSGGVCNPTLSQLVFSGNGALEGGAIYNAGTGGESSPRILASTFTGNSTAVISNFGGGGVSSPVIVNSTFVNNTCPVIFNRSIGGISSPTLINVTISGNMAAIGPGCGGAIYDSASTGQGEADTHERHLVERRHARNC